MKMTLRTTARASALAVLAALVVAIPGGPAFAGASSCTAETPLGTKTTISNSVLTHDAPTMYVGDAARTINIITRSSLSSNDTDAAYDFLGARSVNGNSDIKIVSGAITNPVRITLDAAPVQKGVDVMLTGRGSFSFAVPTTPQVVPLKTPAGGTYPATTVFYKGANGTGDVATTLYATCTPQGEDTFGSFVVKSRSATALNTITGPITAGSTRQVPVSVTVVGGTVAGKARLVVDGVERPLKNLSAGATTLTLDGLSEGSHTVRAQFVPDNATLYDGSLSPVQTINVLPPAVTTTTTLTLNKTSMGSSETLLATAKVAAPTGSPVGTVEFVVDGSVHSTQPWSATDTGVVASITGLATGIHDLQARFVPTNPLAFNASESGTSSVVVRAPSTPTTTVVTLPKNPATSTDLITPTATVTAPTGTPSGTVQFFVDGSAMGSPTAVAADGKATRTLGRVTTPGPHEVTAEFTPANVAQFEPSISTPVTLTITAPGTPTTTTMVLSRTTGTSADLFTATVGVSATSGTPGGSVKIGVDGVDVATGAVSGGSATIDLPALDSGVHTVRATYVPADANAFQASSSATQQVTVTAVTSTTTLTLSPDTATTGSDITASAAVTTSAGYPAGVVEFLVDDAKIAQAPVSAGAATVILPALDAGTYAVTARFVATKPTQQTGSTSSASTLTLTQPVEANPTVTTATLAEDTVTVNDQASVSVDVTASGATPTGSVEVSVNGQVVEADLTAGGTAVSLPTLPVGDYDVVANYVPANAAVFAPSQSATLTLHVVRAAVATHTSLDVSPGIAVVGDDVVATASVSAARGSALGSVVFAVDGGAEQSVPVANRTASLTLSGLSAGEHTVEARFVPTDRLAHTASAATPATVTVVATASTATATGLALAPSTIEAGDSSVVTVTVASTSGVPIGTVEVTLAGEVLTGPLVDGVAQFSTPTYLAVGSHPVVASYLPAEVSAFGASTSTTRTLTVNQASVGGTATATALTLSPSDPTVGDEVTATATVSWLGGAPEGQVRFSIDGNQVGDPVAVTDGVARLALPQLPVKAYLVAASFEPTNPGSTAGSSADAQLRVKALAPVATMTELDLTPSTITEGESSTATATVTPTTGAASGSIVFDVDGSETEVALVDGEAVLELDGLGVGEHDVSAAFEATGTATLPSESITRTLTVTAPAPAPVGTTTVLELGADTATSTQLVPATVRVTAASGGATPVGQASLTVSGVTYRAPLTNGRATISLPSLAVGPHSVAAAFEPGSIGFLASTATARTITITAPVVTPPATGGGSVQVTSTTTTLTAPATVALGGALALRATVDGGTPSGVVRFSTGGSMVSAPLVNGVATGSLTALAMGSSSITATFIPTGSTHSPSWSTATTTVGRAITVATSKATYNKKKRAIDLVTALTVDGGLASVGGKVKIVVKADGKKVVGTSTPIPASGVIKRNFNKLAAAKKYTLVVTYQGSATTTAVTSTTVVKGAKKT